MHIYFFYLAFLHHSQKSLRKVQIAWLLLSVQHPHSQTKVAV